MVDKSTCAKVYFDELAVRLPLPHCIHNRIFSFLNPDSILVSPLFLRKVMEQAFSAKVLLARGQLRKDLCLPGELAK